MQSPGAGGAVTVSPREFIRAWQTSSALAEVAAKVRLNKNACRVRAYRYRQLGVPLKEFPPVEVELPDWDELAQYARSLLPDEHEDGGGRRTRTTPGTGPRTPGRPARGRVTTGAPGRLEPRRCTWPSPCANVRLCRPSGHYQVF
jgi:hypothetical protein